MCVGAWHGWCLLRKREGREVRGHIGDSSVLRSGRVRHVWVWWLVGEMDGMEQRMFGFSFCFLFGSYGEYVLLNSWRVALTSFIQ